MNRLVKDALRGMGYVDNRSPLARVAPMVTHSTGNYMQDEIKTAKALKRIEKAAVKKAVSIKASAARKGIPMPFKTAVKKALNNVVSTRAPKLLRAAKRAA